MARMAVQSADKSFHQLLAWLVAPEAIGSTMGGAPVDASSGNSRSDEQNLQSDTPRRSSLPLPPVGHGERSSLSSMPATGRLLWTGVGRSAGPILQQPEPSSVNVASKREHKKKHTAALQATDHPQTRIPSGVARR